MIWKVHISIKLHFSGLCTLNKRTITLLAEVGVHPVLQVGKMFITGAEIAVPAAVIFPCNRGRFFGNQKCMGNIRRILAAGIVDDHSGGKQVPGEVVGFNFISAKVSLMF